MANNSPELWRLAYHEYQRNPRDFIGPGLMSLLGPPRTLIGITGCLSRFLPGRSHAHSRKIWRERKQRSGDLDMREHFYGIAPFPAQQFEFTEELKTAMAESTNRLFDQMFRGTCSNAEVRDLGEATLEELLVKIQAVQTEFPVEHAARRFSLCDGELRAELILTRDMLRVAPPARNQCDGCQRGLPVDVYGTHRDEQIFGMRCTADRYKGQS